MRALGLAAVLALVAASWATAQWILRDAPAAIAAVPASPDAATPPSISSSLSSSLPASLPPGEAPSSAPVNPQARVLFAAGSMTLTPAARSDLDHVAAHVKGSATSFVVALSRTDAPGSAGRPGRAMERAHVVVDYLADRGVLAGQRRARCDGVSGRLGSAGVGPQYLEGQQPRRGRPRARIKPVTCDTCRCRGENGVS